MKSWKVLPCQASNCYSNETIREILKEKICVWMNCSQLIHIFNLPTDEASVLSFYFDNCLLSEGTFNLVILYGN